MNEQTYLLINKIVVVLIIIALGYIMLRIKSKNDDKEDANKFLLGLQDVFYQKMLEIINTTDYTQFQTVIEAETYIMDIITKTISDYTKQELTKAANDDILSALAVKLVDDKTLSDIIDQIVQKNNLMNKINAEYSKAYIDSIQTAGVEEDKELSEKFSDDSQYVTEELDKSTLSPAESVEPSEEELNNINPPMDDEEDYNLEDSSMEIVDE